MRTETLTKYLVISDLICLIIMILHQHSKQEKTIFVIDRKCSRKKLKRDEDENSVATELMYCQQPIDNKTTNSNWEYEIEIDKNTVCLCMKQL